MLDGVEMNAGYMRKTNFGMTRGPRQTASSALNLGVGSSFEGQPDLLRMIEIAQRAQQVELVKALHEQYRMLLCTPAGVSPGDKEWTEWLKGLTAEIGTITSEKEIPQFVSRIIRRIKRCRAGMLYLNYVSMEALKRYRMPIARALLSSVVTAKFNPDTATKRSMELYLEVMQLVNAATVSAHEKGITVANQSALMEELGRLNGPEAEAKLAPTVGPLLAELDPNKLRLGALVRWRENLNSAWITKDQTVICMLPNRDHPTQVKLAGGPGHVWWVEIEDVRMEAEQPEQEAKTPPTMSEKLAQLNRASTGELDDRRILDLPAGDWSNPITLSMLVMSLQLSSLRTGRCRQKLCRTCPLKNCSARLKARRRRFRFSLTPAPTAQWLQQPR